MSVADFRLVLRVPIHYEEEFMADKSDIKVLTEYFGPRPGSTMTEWRNELQALSREDRAALAALARLELDCQVAA